MAFKPTTWYPIAVVLSVVNLAGAGFAIGQAQPEHAAIHVALAVAFGLWARRLRPRPEKELPGGSELQDRFEALEGEVSKLRQELSETHERLDFVERLLAQGRDARRVGPQHQGPQPDVKEPNKFLTPSATRRSWSSVAWCQRGPPASSRSSSLPTPPGA